MALTHRQVIQTVSFVIIMLLTGAVGYKAGYEGGLDYESPVIVQALFERDMAVNKYEATMEKFWNYADGSCAISAAARGAEWRCKHAGLWCRHLVVMFKGGEGHAMFVFEDSSGRLWIYSNGGSMFCPKGTPKDAMALALVRYNPETSILPMEIKEAAFVEDLD